MVNLCTLCYVSMLYLFSGETLLRDCVLNAADGHVVALTLDLLWFSLWLLLSVPTKWKTKVRPAGQLMVKINTKPKPLHPSTLLAPPSPKGSEQWP